MRSEEQTPVTERYLWLEGFVSESALRHVRRAIQPTWPPSAHWFFVGYAYADLPISKTFEMAYPFRKPERAEPTTAVIQAVTQQFSRRFDSVPHGWKTITLFDFPRGCPQSIARLPILDAWTFALEESVCLADRATVDALLSGGRMTPG
jgi:hypothetical protein